MKKKFKIAVVIIILVAIAVATSVFLTTQDIAVLNPKGLIGIKEKRLIIVSTLLMLIVVIPVFALVLFFAWRYREGNRKAKYTPNWDFNHLIESLWWGIPIIIIGILAVITWTSSHDLNPYKNIENGKKEITINVVALEWKWLFIYPEQGIATVNFLQFPEHTPINFQITADAPMNSFWIPELGGQIYAMPAMKTELNLIANQIGEFRGCSAHLSGKGFAGMVFNTKATSEEDFNKWVATIKKSPDHLNLKKYDELVKQSSYDPAAFYVLDQRDLFDRIIMKYNTPEK